MKNSTAPGISSQPKVLFEFLINLLPKFITKALNNIYNIENLDDSPFKFIKDRNIALILQNNSTKISCEEKQTRRTKISSDPKVQRQTRRKEEEHTKQNSHHRCDDTYNRHGARKWHEFLKRTRHSNKCIFHHNDTTIDSKQS